MNELVKWLKQLPPQQRVNEAFIALRNMNRIEAFAKGAFGPEAFAEQVQKGKKRFIPRRK